ncbi:protein KAKU4 [Punica granatum]|uniref:Uncharacterized protein n=2 Tax=Punica granatum TaxID=22663 RepID=A0A218WX79_PUNGR|nr:protein KAKU4 [Punica granatum]OWM77263.1 hypothetical protein CDL15_Pgr028900 [Punica granatum]PKI51856.1 hypothetical protein CRG98_027774 [Punica granatum]
MAAAGRSRPGSGGKILRPRRVARVATPYDRPPNPNPRPENPSWISKLLLSPTRVIASGAGKFLSSVFGSESSSSSSSSSGSDSGSDNEIDEDDNGIDKCSAGGDELDKEKGNSETAGPIRKESQQAAVRNENKLLIEQLLLRETFSWEECERLTSIIRSRVGEAPGHLDREVAILSDMCNRAANKDVDIPDLCNTALLEAKKWLKEKKSAFSPEIELDPSISPHVNEGQTGSPVDVAKSYMKDRPPWTSPCFNSEAEKSVSPIGIRLFKDDEPLSIGGNSLSSSRIQMKRDAPIIGSWNITEEIRRVRSQATEQMLRTPSTKMDLTGSKPSSSATKFDWSQSVLEYKYSLNSSAPINLETDMGDKQRTSTNLIDASSDLLTLDTTNGPPKTTENRSDNELISLNPPVLISTDDQGLGDGSGDSKTVVPSDNCGVDGTAHKDTNGSSQQHGDIIPDSRVNDGPCSMSKEGTGIGDASAPNGLPHSTSRLNAEERDIRAYDEEQNPPTSSLPTSHLGETHEPRNEPSVEAPNMNENDDIATGSQNSSSMQYEEMSQESQQSRKPAASPKRGRKVTRFGRKVRGRGK